MTQKSLNDAVGPTGMSDATATMLGLKSYSAGTAYNGGGTPTFSTTPAGFVLLFSQFMPYQMQDGKWRLRMSLSYNATSATNLDLFLNVGLLSTLTSSYALYAAPTSGIVPVMSEIGYASSVLSQIIARTASACNGANISGDIALDIKPTWAY